MLLSGNFSLEYLLAAAIVLLFGMGWHEYAHAVVADWWGDPTPRMMGRLTPNPLVHINWIGWIMWLVLGFGILGSVPVNSRAMRDPRWGQFWTSAAGPISNLLQAFVYAILGLVFFNLLDLNPSSNFLIRFLGTLIFVGVFYNVLLFFFNLLPLVLPGAILGMGNFVPMDGWSMLYSALPGRFLNSKSIPQVVWEYLRPLARFLVEPAYTWQAWMPIMGYITLILFVASMVLPPSLDPIWFLIGLPSMNLTYFLTSGF